MGMAAKDRPETNGGTMTHTLKPALLATAVGFATMAGPAAAGDFDGFYLGAYGSGNFSTTPNTYGFGGQAGYLFEFSPGAYAGIEADVYRPSGGPTVYTGAARLGYDFGSPFMPYASVGAGIDGTGTTVWTVGAGAQYDLGGGASLRTGVDRYQPTGGGAANYVGKVGLTYSF